jgi:hypothetical protein
MELLGGNAGFHKGKTTYYPLRKEVLPIFYLHCIGVKENIKLGGHECWHPGY